jgi:hypothetical protein
MNSGNSSTINASQQALSTARIRVRDKISKHSDKGKRKGRRNGKGKGKSGEERSGVGQIGLGISALTLRREINKFKIEGRNNNRGKTPTWTIIVSIVCGLLQGILSIPLLHRGSLLVLPSEIHCDVSLPQGTFGNPPLVQSSVSRGSPSASVAKRTGNKKKEPGYN